MTSRNDLEYYRSRTIAERALSEAATNPVVASIHAQLAECYEKRLGDVPAEPSVLRPPVLRPPVVRPPVFRIVAAQPLPDSPELRRTAS
jgi:hypothetical protein